LPVSRKIATKMYSISLCDPIAFIHGFGIRIIKVKVKVKFTL